MVPLVFALMYYLIWSSSLNLYSQQEFEEPKIRFSTLNTNICVVALPLIQFAEVVVVVVVGNKSNPWELLDRSSIRRLRYSGRLRNNEHSAWGRELRFARKISLQSSAMPQMV